MVGEHQRRGAGGLLAAGRREAKAPSRRAGSPGDLAAPSRPPGSSPSSPFLCGESVAVEGRAGSRCRRRTRAVRGAGKSGQRRAGRDGCSRPSPAKPRRRHRPGEEGDRSWDFLPWLSPGEEQQRESWARAEFCLQHRAGRPWPCSCGVPALVQPFPFPLWYLQPVSGTAEGLGFPALPVIVPCSRDALLPPDHAWPWQQQVPAPSGGAHPWEGAGNPRAPWLLIWENPAATCGQGTCVSGARRARGDPGCTARNARGPGHRAPTGRVATGSGCSCSGFPSPPGPAGSGLSPSWIPCPGFQQVSPCVDRAGVRPAG